MSWHALESHPKGADYVALPNRRQGGTSRIGTDRQRLARKLSCLRSAEEARLPPKEKVAGSNPAGDTGRLAERPNARSRPDGSGGRVFREHNPTPGSNPGPPTYCPLSPTSAEASRSRREGCRFESDRGHVQLRPRWSSGAGRPPGARLPLGDGMFAVKCRWCFQDLDHCSEGDFANKTRLPAWLLRRVHRIKRKLGLL